MSSIFISHSSSDSEIAKELERRLAEQGHSSVFLDLDPEKGIIGGQSWERTLYRKIRACRAVVALVTDSYLDSHWCFAEAALARMEGKHLFALKVDPLSRDANLPSILMEKQYIDLRDGSETSWQRLWQGLERVDVLGVKGEWDPHEPPYLGFGSFREKHAPLFFGREDEARAGVEILERGSPGLIMTLGASGSGKSSLVRAGIVPRLRRLEDRWLIVEPFRPGRNPFRALARALGATFRRYAPDATKTVGDSDRIAARLRSEDPDAADAAPEKSPQPGSAKESGAAVTEDERVRRLLSQLSELRESPPPGAAEPFVNFLDLTLEDLHEIFEPPEAAESGVPAAGETPLIAYARRLQSATDRPEARVLIVVDQFEELLGADSASESSDAFLRLLRQSVEAPDSPVMVLGTMRSDFLGLFQHHPALRAIDYESLSLGPMSPDGMRRVIEEPARLGSIELENGLTDRLIQDTETPDALPLLSFTLWVLWRDFVDDRLIQITEYEKLGGLHGAVVREAEALVAPRDHAALRRAFLAMVRLNDEGQFARKPVRWDSPDLAPVHPQLEQFIDRRLLVVRGDGENRLVEVAHEALFRTWSLLRGWLDQGKAEVLLKQQITRDAKTWESRQRDKDVLWSGGRLLQARELLKRKQLDGIDREFVRKGVQRARSVLWSTVGGAAALIIILVVLTMNAFNAKRLANLGERAAVAAQEEMSEAYEEMIIRILPKVRPAEAAPGPILVDETVLQLSPALEQTDFGTQMAILGRYGQGRVLAVAHDSFVAENPGGNELFLDFGLRWLTLGSGKDRVLYSVGHCEVISESVYSTARIAGETIRDLGFSADPIGDLAELDAVNPAHTVLIVGNAWGTFREDEIGAARAFVDAGGSILLVGLQWSWYDNRFPGGFDPCQFSPFSAGLSKDAETYPMNALGKPFGIAYSPGLLELD